MTVKRALVIKSQRRPIHPKCNWLKRHSFKKAKTETQLMDEEYATFAQCTRKEKVDVG